eukprot:m.10565 g.10565  ORF g.10565 m.10565 type:complete len:405 (-) comp4280_c0_seq2:208-1422(-)
MFPLLYTLIILLTIADASAPPFSFANREGFHNAYWSAFTTLNFSYDANTGVFHDDHCPRGIWWNSANAFLTIAKEVAWYNVNGTALPNEVTLYLSQIYNKTVQPTKDFRPVSNSFNDDHLWWLWFAAELSDLPKNILPPQLQQGMLEAVHRGWEEVTQCRSLLCSGANATYLPITWQRELGPQHGNATCAASNGYIATITNSLFMVVSAFGPQSWLNEAENMWGWLKTHVVSKDGLVHDGLDPQKSCTVRNDTWSYNAGVVMYGLSKLYMALGKTYLLDDLELVASASLDAFVDTRGIIRENQCETQANCGCDGDEFRGPFVRGLALAYKVLDNNKNISGRIAKILNYTMAMALQNDCNVLWQFQLHWAGPYNLQYSPTTQIPALDLIVAASEINHPNHQGYSE